MIPLLFTDVLLELATWPVAGYSSKRMASSEDTTSPFDGASILQKPIGFTSTSHESANPQKVGLASVPTRAAGRSRGRGAITVLPV